MLIRILDFYFRDSKSRHSGANQYNYNKMELQYITDKKGRKNAVQLPIKDWKQIQKDLDELERLRNKKLFLAELAEAVEEMNQIKEGKIQARNAEDFLNEL